MRQTGRAVLFGLIAGVAGLAALPDAAHARYCHRPGVPPGCVARPVARPAAVPGAGAPGVGVVPGAGAGAPGVGVAPRPGVGAYGAGATPGVGYGAPGAGVQPYNAGGPVNRPGYR
jgi:hypothetical protein